MALLFTSYCSRRTVHGLLFTKNCFWIFDFLARVRARADNVFKGNVNNREYDREYSEYDQLY